MIRQIIDSAYSAALKENDPTGASDQVVHRNRSFRWVKSLSAQFRKKYQEPDFRVFSIDYSENKHEFHVNELLFDISVVEISNLPSANGKKLEYVKKCIWQIESEFQSNNSRETLIDFSKLIMGASENKLLIAPLTTGSLKTWLLKTLPEAAVHCHGNLYLALVPHPREWYKTTNENPLVYQYHEEKWLKI